MEYHYNSILVLLLIICNRIMNNRRALPECGQCELKTIDIVRVCFKIFINLSNWLETTTHHRAARC